MNTVYVLDGKEIYFFFDESQKVEILKKYKEMWKHPQFFGDRNCLRSDLEGIWACPENLLAVVASLGLFTIQIVNSNLKLYIYKEITGEFLETSARFQRDSLGGHYQASDPYTSAGGKLQGFCKFQEFSQAGCVAELVEVGEVGEFEASVVAEDEDFEKLFPDLYHAKCKALCTPYEQVTRSGGSYENVSRRKACKIVKVLQSIA